ncbi:hypothetical protein H2198_005475 [Neophaeococcomyces mojaviensis]|uniref:Uncharacterized protein n=1 Tax=Neophaeococcomyces mojaviensis TaxID=3383035 RepID=A0ACC3A5F0_9EURO|nr:hypothetical protein H2198_005475 [Knufia sp. JES_112]
MSHDGASSTLEIQQMDHATELQDMAAARDNAFKDSSASKVRRRNRMITSCLECRRRKLKCDKQQPCSNCNKFSRDCMFLAPALDSVSQKKLNEIKEKMGSLERTLEEDVARKRMQEKSSDRRRSSADLPGEGSESEEGPVPEDEKGLEATPLATVDASYEDDDNDDVLDLGFRVGKFRMTERLGGLFRPKLAEEMVFTLVRDNKRGTEPEAPLKDDAHTCLDPGPAFIPPGSGFIFGDTGSRRSIVDFLPTKQALDLLIKRYHSNVHFLCRVVHWPSFQIRYENFWTSILSGVEPPSSLQAIVFAVSFSAVASMLGKEVSSIFQQSYRKVLNNFQTATEVALGKAQFLRTTRFETLQALIVYLIPMCRGEISRAHSVLVGAAIRLGECFGLHRDPVETFGHNPIDAHLRRIAWFQLCFLDFRSAESQGPRPSIKREDYDTKLPWNLDDAELMAVPTTKRDNIVLQDKEGEWTDTTLSRIRFECNEMHRIVWNDRIRLDKKKISLTHCLAKIESFRAAMEEKYSWLDVSVPIQQYARLLLDMLLLRMHIMILHKFHNATSTRIPDRLRQIIIQSGTKVSESAMIADTDPKFENFKWYGSALQQWHTAFLLLIEVFVYPNRREADRIWAIADHVFEPDLSLTRVQKARSILAAVRDRAAAYRNLRKMREPVSMRNRLNTSLPARGRIRGPEMILPADGPDNAKDPETQKVYRGGNDPLHSGHGPMNLGPEALNNSTSSQSAVSTAALTPGPDIGSHDSWSMDAPFTMFVDKKYTRPSQANASNQNDTTSPPNSGARHPGEPSPSSSSHYTGSENWVPSAGNTTYRFNPNPLSPPLNNHISPSDQSLSPPPLFGNSAMGLMSGQYIPDNQITSNTISSPYTRSSISSGMSPDPMGGLPGSKPVFNPVAAMSGNPMYTAWDPPQQPQQDEVPPAPQDLPMLDIDWSEWDKLFPLEINSGDLDLPQRQTGQQQSLRQQ